MALNPPMFDAAMPFAQVGEFFLCSRHGLALEVTTPGLPKLKSRRSFRFLTTSRIVFVSQPPVQLGNGAPPFVSFELPLRGLTAEKFNPRGLLGANYLSGRAACVPGMGLTGDASFSLTFNEGGAGTFLSLFFRALTESRLPAKQASAHATLRSTVIATGSFRLAVIDPNDPSIIYVTQPAIPTAPLAQGQGQHD